MARDMEIDFSPPVEFRYVVFCFFIIIVLAILIWYRHDSKFVNTS